MRWSRPAGFRLEPAARRVLVDGAEVGLANKEYELLKVLIDRAGQVVSRETILREVWGDADLRGSKTLDMHMSWLRRKIGDEGPAAERASPPSAASGSASTPTEARVRRRILLSILAVVVLTAMLLGVPLMYTAWLWVEDLTRSDLQARLERMAAEIISQEGVGRRRRRRARHARRCGLLVPARGPAARRLSDARATARRDVDIGAPVVGRSDRGIAVAGLGSGSLRLEVPPPTCGHSSGRRCWRCRWWCWRRWRPGAAVAVVTARRLADPLRDVAARAARLARATFGPIRAGTASPELDRVSDVLDSATVEIAGRLQREHVLVADVSHQLRSRLTAVRLRLDELSAHSDPAVVDEAEEAMAQVDRLTVAIDELVRASRADGSSDRCRSRCVGELPGVLGEWERPFAEAGRRLVLEGDERLRAPVTGSRLREAVAVLVDNALVHGGGDCTVTVRRHRTRGSVRRMICVEVADEGRRGERRTRAAHLRPRLLRGGLDRRRARAGAGAGRGRRRAAGVCAPASRRCSRSSCRASPTVPAWHTPGRGNRASCGAASARTPRTAPRRPVGPASAAGWW